jgi:hypothetical protein
MAYQHDHVALGPTGQQCLSAGHITMGQVRRGGRPQQKRIRGTTSNAEASTTIALR